MLTPNPRFPRLDPTNHQVTSPATPRYNCIAWAAGDETRWWWPDPAGQAYWPPSLVREESLDMFVQAFQQLGYEICQEADLEPGFEKVALYAEQQSPTHAARQLPDGKWTSKLGRSEDIRHDLDSVSGPLYGDVVRVLRRRVLSDRGRTGA